MLSKDKVKILFATDQHFNVPKLDTRLMVSNFLSLMKSSIATHQPDVILFGGDWFDRPTSLTSTSGVAITYAMNTIISWCGKQNIALRVLKGTGTHDGVQNDNWESLASGRKVDFKLYKTVDIIDDLGFKILTLPDSTIPNHSKCELAIRSKLAELNLSSVDLMFSHGMFTDHLIGAGFTVPAHDSEYFRSIIKIVGLNGHIHERSLFGNILTGGSTDRTRHGEEHPKGIHLVEVDRLTKTFTATFIEQKKAAIFKTFIVPNDDMDTIVDKLTMRLDPYSQEEIFVRLKYTNDIQINPLIRLLSDKYPLAQFDSLLDDSDRSKLQAKLDEEIMAITHESITPDTINALVAEKLSRMGITLNDTHISVLEEVKDGIN